jgi:hypothetical protein
MRRRFAWVCGGGQRPRAPARCRHVRGGVVVAAIFGVGLVCGACAPSPAVPGSSSSTRTTQPARATQVSAAGNKSRAEAEAARLLAEVQLPAGAVEIATPPAALSGPGVGVPSTSSLIDKARFWRVSMSLDAAVAWIRAHRPAGLTLGASASGGTGHRVETRAIAFADRDTAAWRYAQLQIGVAWLGADVSAIRADGVALWIDPRPMKDTRTGSRMRVTTEGCASTDRGIVGVSNPATDLAERLVPAATPTAGLLCRYAGLNGKPFALIAEPTLSGDAARHITTLARRISLDHFNDEAPWSCPADDGSATVVVLAYRGRADVDLWLPRRGCMTLSNGRIQTANFPDGLGDLVAAVVALGG